MKIYVTRAPNTVPMLGHDYANFTTSLTSLYQHTIIFYFIIIIITAFEEGEERYEDWILDWKDTPLVPQQFRCSNMIRR